MRNYLWLLILTLVATGCGTTPMSAPPTASPSPEAASPPAEPLTIRVGLQGPFSGPAAEFGERLRGGVLYALEKAGPLEVDGRELRLELRIADDEGLPEKGQIAAQQLIDDGVSVVFGPGFSGPAASAIPLFAQREIPMLSPWAADDNLTDLSTWFFRVFPPNKCQAEELVRIAAEAGAKSIVTVDDNQAYGGGISDGIKDLAAAAGLDVRGQYHGSLGLLDWSPIVQRVLQDLPDLVFYNGYPDEAGRFVAQARDRGFDRWIIGSDGVGTPAIFAVADPTKLATRFGALAAIPEELLSGPTESAVWKEFTAEYPEFAQSLGLSEASRDAELYVALAFDSTNLLIDALRRAGTADSKELRSALLSTEFVGLSGPFAYDERGERSLCFSTFLEPDPATESWNPTAAPSSL